MISMILLSLILHRDPATVGLIYRNAPAAPMLAVADVECESWFKWSARHPNYDKQGNLLSTDWHWYQINDKAHNPYHNSRMSHAREGGRLLSVALLVARGDEVKAISYMNSGSLTKSMEWGAVVVTLASRLRNAVVFWGGK